MGDFYEQKGEKMTYRFSKPKIKIWKLWVISIIGALLGGSIEINLSGLPFMSSFAGLLTGAIGLDLAYLFIVFIIGNFFTPIWGDFFKEETQEEK